MSGVVRSLPRDLPGGHVVVRVSNIDITAYEPSKQFRSVVRRLVPGDRVQVVGAIRRRPKTVNLEKILIESTVSVTRKVANPWCPGCQKRTKSMGRQAGFRCIRCGKRFPKSAAIRAKRAAKRAFLWGSATPSPGIRFTRSRKVTARLSGMRIAR